MQVTAISGHEWTQVIDGSTVDTILQFTGGSARLFFGDAAGQPITTGIVIPNGWQAIVPAGLDVWAVAVSSAAGTITTGPFGVPA